MNITLAPTWRLLSCGCLIAAPLFAGADPAARAPSPADAAAYAFGVDMGQRLHQNGVTGEFPMSRVMAGLKDGLAGKRTSPEDQEALQAFLRSAADASVARNVAAAKEFLNRNGQQRGVSTAPSGLQYRIIAPGEESGASPQPTDRVTVRYRGTLLDGSEFDNSSKHPSAAPIAVNNTIKGWQEALGLMKPGAKWQLFVPSELGYGQVARPGVPGGSLLIFDLELTSIQPSPVAPPKAP